MFRSVVALVSLVLLGCAPEEPRDRDATEPHHESVHITDEQREQRIDSLVAAGRSFGDSEDAIRARLGEPTEVVRRDTINPHTDDVDEVIRMVYPGAWFELYRVRAEESDLLMAAALFDPALFGDVTFRADTPREEVEAHLGEPASVSHSDDGRVILDYETLGIGAPMFVSFAFREGGLQEVRWSFYVD